MTSLVARDADFYAEQWPGAVRLAIGIVDQRERAEELTQDAFEKLTSVLDGNTPSDADVPDEAPLIEKADRKSIMKRMEKAKDWLLKEMTTESKYKAEIGKVGHEAAILGALTQAQMLPGYDHIDDEGRVVLSGPMVAHGYHRRSDPAFAVAGSFRTDDLGRVDDGVLTVLGRADDAISTGGLTVVPRVVEDVLAADPAVAQCAVVGVPDERLGEEIVALVVAEPGRTPNPESLRASVAQQVHRHAAPRRILVVDEIPLRGPGKIDRAAVRTLAARARLRHVGRSQGARPPRSSGPASAGRDAEAAVDGDADDDFTSATTPIAAAASSMRVPRSMRFCAWSGG